MKPIATLTGNAIIRKGGNNLDSKNNNSIIETKDYLEKQKPRDEEKMGLGSGTA